MVVAGARKSSACGTTSATIATPHWYCGSSKKTTCSQGVYRSPNDPARELVSWFLTCKKQLVEAGDVTTWSFADYHRTCESIVDTLGRGYSVEDRRSRF